MNIADRISIRLASRKQPVPSISLSQRNIYIFPSKAGFAFIVLLCLMLLTAINYQSSLIYLFTFFLGALFFISIWMCFLNMSGIEVSSGDATDCFAGEDVPFEIVLRKDGSSAFALTLAVNTYKASITELNKNKNETHSVLSAPMQRGVHKLERVYLSSYYPFGLIRAWTWLRLDCSAYVFPKPLSGEEKKVGQQATSSSSKPFESEDMSDLKPYQQGDSTNRVLWKRYAAKDELVTRQREMASLDSSWVRWEDYEASSPEQRLSFMCYDIMKHFGLHARYGVELPGKIIQPATGEAHRLQCLRALAEYGA